MSPALQPTVITAVLIVFGLITCGPLLYIQFLVMRDPQSRKVKDIVIGKDQDWHDPTHFRSAGGGARADLFIFGPLFVLGMAGVLLGLIWGYVLYAAAGAIMLYINVTLWFQEKQNIYPLVGPFAYYTYYWGNFVYWGTASVIYAVLRLSGVIL